MYGFGSISCFVVCLIMVSTQATARRKLSSDTAAPPPKHCIGNQPGNKNSLNEKKCANNNTYCGDWKGREWHPNGCVYRQITSENARKCMKGRTLACIGDSQIRDLCAGVAFLLSDVTVEASPAYKFDHQREQHNIKNVTVMHEFPSWGKVTHEQTFTGFLYPTEHIRKLKKWDWQVQIWELYSNDQLDYGHVEDVLNNKMMLENNHTVKLRPIDFALWSYGLHDWGWWHEPPYGTKYYDSIVKQ